MTRNSQKTSRHPHQPTKTATPTSNTYRNNKTVSTGVTSTRHAMQPLNTSFPLAITAFPSAAQHSPSPAQHSLSPAQHSPRRHSIPPRRHSPIIYYQFYIIY